LVGFRSIVAVRGGPPSRRVSGAGCRSRGQADFVVDVVAVDAVVRLVQALLVDAP
jgi:hypothetical protein